MQKKKQFVLSNDCMESVLVYLPKLKLIRMQHLSRKFYDRILPRMEMFHLFPVDCPQAEPNRPGITVSNRTQIGIVRHRNLQ